MAMTIRPSGPGSSMLRINGQEITTRPTAPVEGPQPAGGVPATAKPVPRTGDTSALQEEMYDAADMASIRGENAAAALQGKKRPAKRAVTKKTKSGADAVEHKRIDGIFADGDPSNRQEQAFLTAAEFEEEVKATDLTFKRKAAQVEVSSEIFRVDLDEGKGSTVMGESAAEIDLSHFAGIEDLDPDDADTNIGGKPVAPTAESMRREETIPNVEISMSETGLRRVLGLNKK